MGCDLVVYKEVDEDVGCSMAYTTFNRLRRRIVFEYLDMNGIKVPEENPLNAMMSLTSDTTYEKVRELLNTIDTDESDAMTVLWTHSDCDGSFYDEDCGYISNVIDKILKRIDKDDEDRDWLESLYSTFKYVGDIRGILQIW